MTKKFKINLPLDLCEYALHERMSKQLYLLLLLKLHCDGTMRRNDPRIDYIIKTYYEGQKRTFDRNLKALLDSGWIWENRPKEILHLHSFNKLRLRINSKNRRCVVIGLSYLKNRKANVSLFMSAIVCSKVKQNRGNVRYMAERPGGGSIIPLGTFPSYYGYGVREIARMIHYSHSGVQKLKKLAIKEGFMSANPKRFFPKNNNLSIHKSQLGNLKKSYPEYADRLWQTKGFVFLILNDELISHLSFVSRRLNKQRLHIQSSKKRAKSA